MSIADIKMTKEMTLYSKAKRIFLQKKYTFYWTNLHILNSSFHAIFILFLSWFWNAIHFKLLYHYQTSKFWEISFNKKAQWGKNEPSSLAIRMFAWKNVVFDADIMTWLNDKRVDFFTYRLAQTRCQVDKSRK